MRGRSLARRGFDCVEDRGTKTTPRCPIVAARRRASAFAGAVSELCASVGVTIGVTRKVAHIATIRARELVVIRESPPMEISTPQLAPFATPRAKPASPHPLFRAVVTSDAHRARPTRRIDLTLAHLSRAPHGHARIHPRQRSRISCALRPTRRGLRPRRAQRLQQRPRVLPPPTQYLCRPTQRKRGTDH